ncbi:MAG TPA: hypothetical protein VMY35_20000 [Phycisphaerae bacterium]|nr:hypothetical protein [Phycisphaerae bacterium]
MPPSAPIRLWLRRGLWLLAALTLGGGLVAFVLWPRQEVFYTDGSQTWPADADLALRSVLWDKGESVPLGPVPGEPAVPEQDYDPCLSADGQELYFTRGRAGRNADILVACRTPDGWSDPEPIGEINTDADEIGPALAPDSATLYFFSNREGGEGGYDLYVSRHDGTRWSRPENLGPRVNSPFNEYDPCVTPDGLALVFASNRPTAEDERPPEGAWPATLREQTRLYDYDLYALDLEEPAAEPRRLDAVSGPSNDGQPAVSPDGRWLYFASDRTGGRGGFDLWRARITPGAPGPPLGALLPPENVGAPVNTRANELDPAVALEGFGLYFSSDRAEPNVYHVYYTRSHEVYPIVRTRRLALGPIIARLSWPLLGLLLALAGLALAILALAKLRKRPGLLASAMIASLLLHLVALSLFTLWRLSVGVYELAHHQERFEVAVSIPGLAESELSAELRAALTDLARVDTARFALEKRETLAVPAKPTVREPEIAVATPAPAPPDLAVALPKERPEEITEPLRPETAPAPVPDLEPPEPVEIMQMREARPAPAPEPVPMTPVALVPREEPAPVPEAPAPPPTAAPAPLEPALSTSVKPTIEARTPAPPTPTFPPEAPSPVALESPAVLDVAPAPSDLLVRSVRPSEAPAEAVSVRPLAASRPEAPAQHPAEALEPVATVGAPAPAAPAVGPAVETPSAALAPAASPAAPEAAIAETPALAAAPVAEAEVLDVLPAPSSAVAPREGPGAPGSPAPAAEVEPPQRALVGLGRPEESVALTAAPAVEGPRAAEETRLPESAVGSKVVEAPLVAAAPPAARILDVPMAALVARTAVAPPAAEISPPDAGKPAGAPEAREPRAAAAPAEVVPLAALAPVRAPAAETPAPLAALAVPAVGPAAVPPEPAPETPLPSAAAPGPAVAAPVLGKSVRVAALPPPAPLQADVSPPPEPLPLKEIYTLRTQPERERRIEKLGGTPETEEAVRLALVWFVRHQSPDGRWAVRDFMQNYEEKGLRSDGGGERERQNVGVTGLAALAFLGAGHTHIAPRGSDRTSEHAGTVAKALDWLLAGQQEDGDLRQGGQMYDHALATMVLAESYTMTGDPRLVEPVRKAVQFILDAQNPDLGWRYEPRASNDTSVVGWQIMALKSAEIAGFEVPMKAYRGAANWLDQVRKGNRGGLYEYQPGSGPSPAMTAEGLFIEQYIQFEPGSPRTAESVEYMLQHTPAWVPQNQEQTNLYYWYYATLALHNLGGKEWDEWNRQIRECLVQAQRKDGPFAGSWDPRTRWGSYGGRVYSTAMAALTLEVYYRYLPFYNLSLGESGERAAK